MKDECLVGNENFEISDLSMLFVYHDNTSVIKTDRHMESLIYVLRGKIRLSENDGKYDYTAEEGDLLYIPNGEKNTTYYLDEDNKLMVIKFISPTNRMLGDAKIIKKGSNGEALLTAMHIAQQLEEHRDKDHSFFYMLTYKLIYEINQHCKKQVQHKFHKLFPVIAELRAHPEADHKICDYADMCSMSEVGFRKLFIEYTGKTPVEYRTQLRLKMAADMLLDGEYSVTEAAARSGFNSISFFCREFKKFYGYSAGNIVKSKV